DLKVYFRIADLVDVEYDTTELSLKGSVDLNEGTQLFWGRDSIRIVGPGDVNGDGFVGQADLSIIISNWGLDNASYEQGDVSGDGVVEGADYSQVMSYWGQSTPTPEPATLALVLLGSLAVLSRRGAKSGRKGGLYKKNVACTG
ncbi:MAG: PEP-CTERM sorting domain-containing protein, partial [Phycisphaerae bacterium]|nr:PEP-CTERM sorting domain-containing protein [Phycisphaerae bacterium]